MHTHQRYAAIGMTAVALLSAGACDRRGDVAAGTTAGTGAADPEAVLGPYAERFRALMTRGQEAAGGNFLELLAAADAELSEVTSRFGAPITRTDGSVVHVIDFDALWSTGPWQGERDLEQERGAARQALAALTEAGAWDRWAAMVRAPRYDREIQAGALTSMELPHLAAERRISRALRAAAREAIVAGDVNTAAARVGDMLALSRQAAREPVMLGHLVALAIEASALQEARTLARAEGVSGEGLGLLAGVLDEHRMPPLDVAVEGELILFESVAADVYANGPAGLARLRGSGGGSATSLPAGGLGEQMPGREAEEKEARAAYAALIEAARLPRSRRQAEAPAAYRDAGASKSLLMGVLWPAVERSLSALDQAAAERAGTRVIVALEQWRREHGAYPDALAALVPGLLNEAPADPYTGQALGYLPPSGGPYAGGRAYVLYAAGPDARDDGGKVDAENRFRLMADGVPISGVDFLLND